MTLYRSASDLIWFDILTCDQKLIDTYWCDLLVNPRSKRALARRTKCMRQPRSCLSLNLPNETKNRRLMKRTKRKNKYFRIEVRNHRVAPKFAQVRITISLQPFKINWNGFHKMFSEFLRKRLGWSFSVAIKQSLQISSVSLFRKMVTFDGFSWSGFFYYNQWNTKWISSFFLSLLIRGNWSRTNPLWHWFLLTLVSELNKN